MMKNGQITIIIWLFSTNIIRTMQVKIYRTLVNVNEASKEDITLSE